VWRQTDGALDKMRVTAVRGISRRKKP